MSLQRRIIDSKVTKTHMERLMKNELPCRIEKLFQIYGLTFITSVTPEILIQSCYCIFRYSKRSIVTIFWYHNWCLKFQFVIVRSKFFSEKVLTTFHVVVNKLTVYGIIWLIILIHHQVFQFVVGGIRIQSSQMTHEEEGAKNVIIRAPYCLNEV